MAWEPILEGDSDLAIAARTAAREATDALLAREDAPDSIPPALFWAYAAGAYPDDEAVAARFESSVDQLFTDFLAGGPPRLYGGSVGRAFTIAHVSDNTEALTAFDEQLIPLIADVPEYDLISGTVGIGVYFLERLHHDPTSELAHRGLEAVLAHLSARAIERDDGTTWFTPPELLPAFQLETAPNGYYNLGVAHGVPGVAAILGSIATTAADAAKRGEARKLAVDALRWVRSQATPDTGLGQFRAWVTDPPTVGSRRTAWCYGDIGVAVACFRAATAIGEDTSYWLDIARECANRAFDDCRVFDANLCHGATGLAHAFNRLFQTTHDPVFRDAARTWFQRALDFRRPDEGIAGFTKRLPAPGSTTEFEFRAAPDFLDGTAGVVVACHAACHIEPRWDQLLLLG